MWEEALGPNWQSRRGRGADKFCMARHGDRGAYAVGNVKIVTNAENASEQGWPPAKRKRQSKIMREKMNRPETRQRCSIAKLGKPGNRPSAESVARRAAKIRGRKNPLGSKAKLGALNPIYGLRMFNNGYQNAFHRPGFEPTGWKRGRKP